MKMIRLVRLSTDLLYSVTNFFSKPSIVTPALDEDIDDFDRFCNQARLIKKAVIAASAAYPSNIDQRDKLSEIQDVVPFYSVKPGRKDLPAGFASHTMDKATGRHKITVSFRGTETTIEDNDDWATNVKFWKSSGSQIGIAGYVHSGFLDRYLQSREAVFSIINEIVKNKGCSLDSIDFLFTGHSLGGALSTLAAADIKNKYKNIGGLDLVTFSSPRVVDDTGASFIENLLDNRSVRIWRKGDPFTMMIPGNAVNLGFFTGYKHVGLSVPLAPEEERFSIKNHSLLSLFLSIRGSAFAKEPVQQIQPRKEVWTKVTEGLKTTTSRMTRLF
ncbi:MAG: lipase family protein [Alphaproteobacteria bacterium]|nr:lipase family protein [Alphaproteobacteria bacterium]